MRVLRKALAWCSAPVQELTFRARTRRRGRRGTPRLVGEPKPGDGELLASRYELAPWRDATRVVTWKDGLWRLAALERLFHGVLPRAGAALHAIDVGPQSWSYVFPLARFLARWAGTARTLTLEGWELDAQVRLPDGRTREEWAAAWCALAAFAKPRYVAGDFLRCDATGVDLVTCFFPFVTRYALLAWGLPLSCFRPRELLAHAVTRLAPGGLLVTVHQTRAECDATLAHLRALSEHGAERIQIVKCAALDPARAPDPATASDRHGIVVRRLAAGA